MVYCNRTYTSIVCFDWPENKSTTKKTLRNNNVISLRIRVFFLFLFIRSIHAKYNNCLVFLASNDCAEVMGAHTTPPVSVGIYETWDAKKKIITFLITELFRELGLC